MIVSIFERHEAFLKEIPSEGNQQQGLTEDSREKSLKHASIGQDIDEETRISLMFDELFGPFDD